MHSLSVFTLRGFFLRIPRSAVSYDWKIFGIISVPTSIHNINIVFIGNGIWNKSKHKKGTNSGTFDVKLYPIIFFNVSKITLPCFIPFKIFGKLSSSKRISAASLATSVPTFPIAIPISAFLIAGESFTPSPVTATI